MPLSISSFDPRLAALPWLRIAGVIALVPLIFAVAMELDLYALGYHPTAHDSREKWTAERVRAGRLGSKALILIGASRIQLGVDLDELRKQSGLEPVQLAINGSSASFPILKGLADDPGITGTILVDYYDSAIEAAASEEQAEPDAHELDYENEAKKGMPWFSLSRIEADLTEGIRGNLRSYADEATPLTSLLYRVMPQKRSRQYLVSRPDRSMYADYSNVAMPEFYYGRVARTLGVEQQIDLHAPNIENLLAAKIDSIQPGDNRQYLQGTQRWKAMIAKIEARGGRVILVKMPTSGMVRTIEAKRNPRQTFLNLFERETGKPVLVAEDRPEMQALVCPDGSHLDFRDRRRFTDDLVKASGLHGAH